MTTEPTNQDVPIASDARVGSRHDEWSRTLTLVGQQRDQQAFKILFQHFAPLIKGFCLANISHQFPAELAEELVQEVMIKVWHKAPLFDSSKAAASTWIYTIMRNTRIDFIRRNIRGPSSNEVVSVDDLWDLESGEDSLIYLQQRQGEASLARALQQLPPEQRHVLDEVYVLGKTHQEIAGESGIPLGTIKSRVRIGLKKLQVLMEQEEAEAQRRRTQWVQVPRGKHD